MRWLILGCLGLLSAASIAKDVAGVNLPEQVLLEGSSLVLNGAGVREKFFFDIYVAALYLPEKKHDAKVILEADRPWRLRMDFLYSEVSREKLNKSWDEGFEANAPADQLPGLQERLQKFKTMFTTMHKGDAAVLDYLPGKGVRVTIKDEDKGWIPGADFARALLRVWIGSRPVTGSVKKALLGS
ncbi:chalcone isomerase family protein [Thiolapillus sp.]